MVYSDVVNAGLILPKKNKYTIQDVYNTQAKSLFEPVDGSTLTLRQAAWIVKCSAIFHDTEYSKSVSQCAIESYKIF